MTSSNKPSRAADALKANRNWRKGIIILVTIFVLAIGATVYYGATVLPAQAKKADKAACKVITKGYSDAQKVFIAELKATDHTPDPNKAISNYVAEIMHSNNVAFTTAAKSGDLQKALSQMALIIARYQGTVTTTPQFPAEVDSGEQSLVTTCKAL